MSEIVAVEYLSIDGRMEMEDPEAKEEELGGWTAPYWTSTMTSTERFTVPTPLRSPSSPAKRWPRTLLFAGLWIH